MSRLFLELEVPSSCNKIGRKWEGWMGYKCLKFEQKPKNWSSIWRLFWYSKYRFLATKFDERGEGRRARMWDQKAIDSYFYAWIIQKQSYR